MEFPPEIVCLIRDFSRPVFQHYVIHWEILRVFKFNQWPQLKEALSDEKTQSLVNNYLTSYRDWIEHKHVMEQYYRPIEDLIVHEDFVIQSKKLKQQLTRKQYREQQMFREISLHLYGESRILVDIRRELEKIGI